MLRKIAAATLGIVIVAGLTGAPALATPPSVTVDDSAVANLAIPKSLPWSARSLGEAKKAEAYLAGRIQAQVAKLKKNGAVTVQRIFVKTFPPITKNWHDYVPSFRQWYLKGTDSAGKPVKTSASKPTLYPEDTTNLAGNLVTFGPNGCSLIKRQPKQCEITKPSANKFLNVALVDWVSHVGRAGYGVDEQAYYFGLIQTCLESTQKYTLTQTSLLCPGNAEITSDPSALEVPLVFYNKMGPWGYTLTVNTQTNTAVMKLTAVDYSSYAKRGDWVSGSSVINFSQYR
jgi:hypothetical protein